VWSVTECVKALSVGNLEIYNHDSDTLINSPPVIVVVIDIRHGPNQERRVLEILSHLHQRKFELNREMLVPEELPCDRVLLGGVVSSEYVSPALS
jgi:hypothetical protein